MGPATALAKAKSWGQVTLRPDTPHCKHHQHGCLGWERVLSLQSPPLFLTCVIPPEAPESTRRTWGGRDHLLEWPGLALNPLSSWFWVPITVTLSPRVCNGEKWSAPSLGPNLLGYLLILVGALVLSKNIRDSWQGLRQNEN